MSTRRERTGLVHGARDVPRVARAFFARETARVARELLGHTLVSLRGGARVAGEIVECEAYVEGDTTNHAARGPTARNAPMFAQPGTAYVYFTYGMHWCLNVATERAGVGTAVLIRALRPLDGLEVMRARRGARASERDLCRGPARLCVALAVDGAANGADVCAPDASVFVERAGARGGVAVPDALVACGPRVGVVGASGDIARPLRFWIAGSPYASRAPAPARRSPR